MKKYQDQARVTPVLVDVTCDVCHTSCRTPLDNYEYATLAARWGYHSRKDGTTEHMDLCEDCFDDVVKYLHAHKKAKTQKHT